MSKKAMNKTLAIVFAMLLVCIVSVTGTVAYLQHTTAPVVNTFTVGKLLADQGVFELKEHAVVYTKDGVYELGTEEVIQNTYDKILPGVDIPKDPFVRVKGLAVDSAYLFIEVVGLNALSPNFSATVDANNWEATELTGKHGGKVYIYNQSNAAGKISSDIEKVGVLTDNEVTVAPNCAQVVNVTLKFYGYLMQAGGFADYAAAWSALTVNNSGN